MPQVSHVNSALPNSPTAVVIIPPPPPPLSPQTFPILFPRQNAGNQGYTAAWVTSSYTYQCDAVLLGGGFEAHSSVRGPVYDALHAGNGLNTTCLAFQYMCGDHWTENNRYSMGRPNSPKWWQKIVDINAQLYVTGTSGTMEINFFNTAAYNPPPGGTDPTTFQFFQVNTSTYCPVDSNGDNMEKYLARAAIDIFINGTGVYGKAIAASSKLDGFFHDNTGGYCGGGTNQPAQGDWNRDGTTDTTKNAPFDAAYRGAFKNYIDFCRNAKPNLLVMGNFDATAVMQNGLRVYQNGSSGISPLAGTIDGSMLETVFGATYSQTRWSTYAEAVKTYTFHEDVLVKNPALIMVGCIRMAPDGSDFVQQLPWKAFRWSFCFTLIHGNGGYCNTYSNDWKGVNQISADGIANKMFWFDEYSANPTTGVCASGWATCTANRKWLGTALDPKQTYNQFFQGTVHRRRFTGTAGKTVHVFNNSSKTASQVITMVDNLRRLTGTQDTVTNNGALQNIGSTITIPPMDGIILIDQ